MLAVIILLTIATIAAAALWLVPRMGTRVVFDERPDTPVPFGLRMAWLAIRSEDPSHVAAVLGLEAAEAANWATGIGTVYDESLADRHVFVSPPVEGWVFVVGLGLPFPMGQGYSDTCTPVILELGSEFREVQYFFGYPLINVFAWARFADGKLVRAYAVGDHGTLWNKGRVTAEERALGIGSPARRARGPGGRAAANDDAELPSEFAIPQLAGAWSIDPTTLDRIADVAPASGWVAQCPGRWRPQRLQKAG